MFADIVGFTTLCKEVSPAVVMELLNKLYSRLDELATIFKVYKVTSQPLYHPDRSQLQENGSGQLLPLLALGLVITCATRLATRNPDE